MRDEKRQRNTIQSAVILEELRKVTCHPTAAEVYDFAKKRIPKLSLGTVYRNLERFVREGTIQKLNVSTGECRFDGNPLQHHHIRCTACGRVDDLPDPQVDFNVARMSDGNGYQISGYLIEFTGLCPDCQNDQPKGRIPNSERETVRMSDSEANPVRKR